jgi:hypothetical protein
MSNIVRSVLLVLSFCPLSASLLPVQASAQDSLVLRLEQLEPVELRMEARAELASIDYQSSLATAGYVTSVVSHVAGIGLMAVGAIGGFCIDLSGGGCGDRSGWHALAGIGAVMASVGLIGIFVSVGLDVDSGHRRRDWRRRYDLDVDVAVAPTDGGGSFALIGRF